MSLKRILIVEDDLDIVEMVSYNLKKEGYRTSFVTNGRKAVDLIKKEQPDLIILDLMLPEIDGLEICRILKSQENTSTVPIIMLTAKSQEADKVIGLEIGADDYLPKPFSPRELMARIKAVLRRYSIASSNKRIIVNNISLDILKHKVTAFNRNISLTPTEFKLLEMMIKQPGVVLSRDKILNVVFGYNADIYDRTIDTHMKSLRKKLGKSRNQIETIRGIGYRFKDVRK